MSIKLNNFCFVIITDMEDESLYVNEGMENIKKTQSALQSLETKLNQYVSRSRDSNEKKIK